MKLQEFSRRVLESEASYTRHHESFYRLLDNMKSKEPNIYALNDKVSGLSVEDCFYLNARDHEAIGFAMGLALGNFLSPLDKNARAVLKHFLEQLIESGVLRYGPVEMYELFTTPIPTSTLTPTL